MSSKLTTFTHVKYFTKGGELLMNIILLREKLQQFLLEDIVNNDITSSLLFSPSETTTAHFHAKDDGVLSGVQIINLVYELIDPTIKVTLNKSDGEKVNTAEVIATVTGSVQHILTGERVILNLLQRMSGIATTTAQARKTLNSDHTRICDTRKTTPGLRMFEKYAVTCGGGFNHRFGLYDGVMIKDNHIAHHGSITAAVHKVREGIGPMVKIEVETETQEQVIEAVKAASDIIMFDNQTPKDIISHLKYVPDTIITEASGGITLETLANYKDTGVDYISLGFLTHSIQALDISLSIESIS